MIQEAFIDMENMLDLLEIQPTVVDKLNATAIEFPEGTALVFRQKHSLEDAIGSHACLLEALACA
jgi:ABC-type transport system involved in Fe-S cluster assembly fused permease/ATPase subunit